MEYYWRGDGNVDGLLGNPSITRIVDYPVPVLGLGNIRCGYVCIPTEEDL